jgi:prepilin-type N-terminal cleavage/methylation domain-containing protein
MVKTNQKGFTLLELAIVLVIIGIILGAILKGQELINNAKAKRLLNDTKGLATLQYTFYDRYGRFAGDCDNNGAIDLVASSATVPASFGATSYDFCYNPASPSPAPSSDVFDVQWKELGKAQLVSFSNAREIARNPYSGALYAASTPDSNYTYYNVVVATQVPCYAAKVVDQAIDNSLDANNGNVRILKGTNFGGDGTSSGDASNAATWDCASEQQLVAYVYFFDRRPN